MLRTEPDPCPIAAEPLAQIDRMARRAFARSRRGRGRRFVSHGDAEARRPRRVSLGPHPRRGVLRHRRGCRSFDRAAAYAAGPQTFRRGRERARHRRQRHDRGLRQSRPLLGAAGVVDVPRLRRQERLHPRRRLAEMESRESAAGNRRWQTAAASIQCADECRRRGDVGRHADGGQRRRRADRRCPFRGALQRPSA